LPGKGQDTLPGVEKVDKIGAACAGEATDVERGKGIDACGFAGVKGACNTEEVGISEGGKGVGCGACTGSLEGLEDFGGVEVGVAPDLFPVVEQRLALASTGAAP